MTSGRLGDRDVGRGWEDSPKLPTLLHEQFLAFRTEGRCGQCLKGGCW